MSETIDVNEGKGGVGFRIRELWAFLAVHDDNDEGVVGMLTPNGWVPMVVADKTRLDQLLPKARELARSQGKTIRLVRFHVRQDVEVFHPDGRRERPAENT
jgi:hypothetical protein